MITAMMTLPFMTIITIAIEGMAIAFMFMMSRKAVPPRRP